MNKNVKTINIEDRIVEYTVEYRNVKYIRYELRRGKLKLIVPKRRKVDIAGTIHKKHKWIYKKLSEFDKENELLLNKTKNIHLEQRSLPELRLLVGNMIDEYEKFLNVKVNRLQFRDTVHKWGSCSSLRNITLSKNLRYLPDKLVAYIVYHELAHIIVLSHDDGFYEIIKKKFPDYEECDEQLKEYQFVIETH